MNDRALRVAVAAAFAAGFFVVASSCGGSHVCAASSESCDGQQVDTQHDVNNCGGCGSVCAAGAACECGACSCPSGNEICFGRCADTRSDSENCGACGHRCPGGQVCSNGACGCAEGTTACGSSCRDLSSDGLNCGACGIACAVGQHCTSGACIGQPIVDAGAPDSGTDGGVDAGACISNGAGCTGGASNCCSGYCTPVSSGRKCATPPDAGVCLPTFASCTAATASNCCSGYCAPTLPGATCSPAPSTCRPDQGSCGASSECCSLACANGQCVADAGPCQPDSYACTNATAPGCCSGYCFQTACEPVPTTCRSDGTSCGGNGQCCSLSCSDNSDAGTGTCLADAGSCTVNFGGCTSGSTCCSGYCNSNSCMTSPWSACVNHTTSYSSCATYCASIGLACQEACTTHGGTPGTGAAAWQPSTNCAGNNAGATTCSFQWNDNVGDPPRWECCCK